MKPNDQEIDQKIVEAKQEIKDALNELSQAWHRLTSTILHKLGLRH